MKPAPFAYHRAHSVAEAVALPAELGEEAKILAGGPMLVEGQLRGGVAQGIGGALFEEFGYDEAGQPQAITFIEYQLPTTAEIPPVDVLLFQDAPAPGNPLGVMGAGEGGINAIGAAIANAVRDALGPAGGVRQLPLTPARVRVLCEPTPCEPTPCEPTREGTR